MKRILLFIVLAFSSLVSLAKLPERGNRYFLDYNFKFGESKNYLGERTSLFAKGASFTYGRQLDNNWCVGAGLTVHYYEGSESFLDCRELSSWYLYGQYDFEIRNYTPFVDMKVGTIRNPGGGWFLAPSLGYRWTPFRWMAFNIKAGLNIVNPFSDRFSISHKDGVEYITYEGAARKWVSVLNLSLGVEF